MQRLASSYDAFLVGRREAGHLVPRTLKSYRQACAALLAFASEDGRPEPVDRDVRRLLWAKPGLRASVGPFLSWLRSERGIVLVIPHRAARNTKRVELQLIADVAKSMAELEALGPGPRHSAVLAFALAKLLAIPLEAVLRLRWQDFVGPDCATLQWRDGDIELPLRLAIQIAKLDRRTEDLVFVGRTALRPSSTGAVAYHRRSCRLPAGGAAWS